MWLMQGSGEQGMHAVVQDVADGVGKYGAPPPCCCWPAIASAEPTGF